MYICLDTQKMYYDETNNKRVLYNYTGVNTQNDMRYYITPTIGTTYYCWEDNSLWLWNNKWISLYTDVSYPSAYVYDDNRNIEDIYNGVEPYTVLDNNGLLKDGSVVIRDTNRIVKGKIYIEQSNDNMTISSFLGGGIRLLPNGKMSTDGELLIGDNGKSYLRSEFHNRNNEMFVDYSEIPELDPSTYPNSSHIYEVFHEGNLDVSAIKVITPQDIYTKLQDPSLPSPLDLNVKKISGKTIDEISLVGHTHLAKDITDFNDKARAQALVQVNDVFSRMTGEGISVSYNSTTTSFKMTANSFNLTFTGGATGSALVSKLSDTSIDLTIDPSKHVHQNYINTMNDLQDQINNIVSVNPENYYNKTQIDNKLTDIAATDVPTAGKPLKVDNNLMLPCTSVAAQKLESNIDIILDGDITGTVNTDLSGNVTLNTNANNIVSDVATSGKALKIDNNGNLPANSISSSKLNHDIKIALTGEVSANINIDTETTNTIQVNATLNPGSNILQSSDLGVRVASLDSGGKIPSSQLPASQTGLVPKGNWNPVNGAPTLNPVEGNFWIADTEGTFDNKLFQIGDWCLYYNSSWNKIDTNDNVLKVNNKTGNVILNASDVGAIDTSYINYTVGNTIPQNKLVLTSSNGQITGASIEKLIRPIEIITSNTGDVIVDSTSTAASSDGSADYNIKLTLTNDGLTKIKNNTGYKILNDYQEITYKNQLNFTSNFKVTSNSSHIDIDLDKTIKINTIYYSFDFDNTQLAAFKSEFYKLYSNLMNEPFMIYARVQHTSPNRQEDYVYYFATGDYIPISTIISSGTVVTMGPLNWHTDTSRSTTTSTSIEQLMALLQFDFSQDPNTQEITTNTFHFIDHYSFIFDGLSTTNLTDNQYYSPTTKSQPTSKGYVDQAIADNNTLYGVPRTKWTIGDGINSTFSLGHPFNTTDIVIFGRNNLNGKVESIECSSIATDRITFTAPRVYQQDEMTIYILKM